MKAYEEKAYLNDSKIENIKDLMDTMKKNKKIIESLTDMSSSLISKPLELQNQLEETFEKVPDNVKVNQNQSMMSMFLPFNLPSTSLNSTTISATSLPVLDDYFMNDYEQFKLKIKPNKIQTFNSNDTHLKSISTLIEHLNHPDYKSKHNILNEVIRILEYIKKETMDDTSDVCYSDNEQIISYIKNLENSLKRCEETEKVNTQAYIHLINKRIEVCNRWLNNKDEVTEMFLY